MIDICIALDQSVSPHTGVRTIQNTALSLLPFFGTRLRRQKVNLAPTQYRQLRRLLEALWEVDNKIFTISCNNLLKLVLLRCCI